MSTTGIESWAVDLKDVGALYPFQGAEGLFLIIGVVLWLGWHGTPRRPAGGGIARPALRPALNSRVTVCCLSGAVCPRRSG